MDLRESFGRGKMSKRWFPLKLEVKWLKKKEAEFALSERGRHYQNSHYPESRVLIIGNSWTTRLGKERFPLQFFLFLQLFQLSLSFFPFHKFLLQDFLLIWDRSGGSTERRARLNQWTRATLSDSTKEPFKDEIHMNLKDSLLIS